MRDIPEFVEAGTVQGRARAQALARRDADRRRKKAGLVFLRRAVVFVLFNATMGALWALGWVVPELAAFLIGMSCAFFAVWLGAWMQFNSGGRRLLYVKLS